MRVGGYMLKKITAFLLIICILFCMPLPMPALAEERPPKVYIFGDEWAGQWGEALKGFFYEPQRLINAAGDGELLSAIDKKKEYSDIGASDIVILSYGVLEKDRPGDKNDEFKKKLEKVTADITKKGATVMFASVCSSMRFNTMTHKMGETKNFYTETVRAEAKRMGASYIDLARLTAEYATKLGSGNAGKLYKTALSLTDNGNRMCAYEVFCELCKIPQTENMLRLNLSQIKTVENGEKNKSFDVFFEDNIVSCYAVYVKNGVNVRINNVPFEHSEGIYETKSINSVINVDFDYCEKIQLTPVFKFYADGKSTEEEPFSDSMLPGLFDVSVKKTEPLKASVYLNGYLVAQNLDMPGSEKPTEAAVGVFKKYHLQNGKFEVSVKGLTDKLDFISFKESDMISDEKPSVFVAGDSTLCNYYPLLRTGQEPDGTVMTGWAMLLSKYIDADVVNLAASGDWADNWLKKSFPIVEKEGEPGDIFVIQFGINDHDKSNVDEMTCALGKMIDVCAEKKMIPILVSPQISAGYGWGEESNVGKSDGGVYAEFFDAVRALSAEKGCFYVDLTDLSSGWFSEVGRENVYKKYHLWDYENDKPGDMMHLSYKGADAMCRFFVMALKNFSDADKRDKWDNSLKMLKIW